MKLIKVVYDSKNDFILGIVEKFKQFALIETYNLDLFKEKKSGTALQTRFGTKKTPLIVFANENLEEVDAVWCEDNPDWEKSIKNKLKKLYNGNTI
jgi:hypothetical protein